MSENNRHFTAIVIGDNPDEIIKKYDSKLKVEPYVIYRFKDAHTYKENTLNAYKSLANNESIPDSIREEYADRVKEIEVMDDIDFYLQLTDGLDVDDATGDVTSDANPEGHYISARLGKQLAMPLINKAGEEVFQARKSDIDWSKIHLAKQDIYKAAWEMVMGDRKPVTDEEKIVYENMKNRTEYFSFFGTEENYVLNSTAFWGYACVDENGWIELDDNTSQTEWVGNFYDRFIKNLPGNTLISVYECIRD